MNDFLAFVERVFIDRLDVWLVLGFVAQAMFTARFLVQWIASERARKSVMPLAFWIFSLAGGGLLFIYAVHIEDPVFILGQGFGVVVYTRNLVLISRQRRATESEATG